ncbi:hypothetical protein ILYODFUR_035686 [Ilyodon furcidens]|uniref:Secreted protein n=1 Tax=Ilyodon furcidens TaxID=33524 RepID=A0ABV0U0H9_9TELE
MRSWSCSSAALRPRLLLSVVVEAADSVVEAAEVRTTWRVGTELFTCSDSWSAQRADVPPTPTCSIKVGFSLVHMFHQNWFNSVYLYSANSQHMSSQGSS